MEKSQITTQVSTVQPADDGNNKPEQNVSHWEPGYARRFPILGFASILFVLVCALASVAVLVISNNKSSMQWTQKLSPNVVLSALNAASNLALIVAVTRGASIAWWRKAMHGATVTQLHDSWSQTVNFMDLLKHLFRLDVIGVAALAAKVSVIDGILFQRATTTTVGQDITRNISMLAVAATEFPQTGYVVSDGFAAQSNCECFMIGDNFTPIVNNWETSNGFFKGYNKFFQACDGTCFAYLEAIGFEVDCTKQQTNTNLAETALAAYNASSGNSADSSAWTNLPIFNSSFSVSFPNATRNYSTIDLSLLYFQSEDPYNPSSATCPGTLYSVQCTMRPAMVTYPVTITNYTNEHIINGVSLGIFQNDEVPDVDEVLNQPAIIKPYSYTNKQAEDFQVGSYIYPDESLTINSTTRLGGIANALSQYLSSTAAITYAGTQLWALKQQGTLAQTMMYGPPNMGSCDCSFKADALDTIIDAVNQLTFMTALGTIDASTWSFPAQSGNTRFSSFSSASGKQQVLTVNSSTTATVVGIGQNLTTNFRTLTGSQEIRDVIFYRTDFLYMGLGAALTVCCVLLILPIYWKYGELGRDVTLGPIEIAGAFRAPILSHATSPSAAPQNTVGDLHSTPASPTAPTSPIAPTIAFADVDQLLSEVGHRRVTYGFVDVEEPIRVSTPGSPLLHSTGTFKRRSVMAFQDAANLNVQPAAGVTSPPTSPRV